MAVATIHRTFATDCSGCHRDVVVDLDDLTITVAVESVGARGKAFVAAHHLTDDVGGDDELLTWDCPRCGHADSLDLGFHGLAL